jgi:multidrug transporter EmrE-like cation transporter
MTMHGFLLIVVSVTLSAFGQVSFKIGVDRSTTTTAGDSALGSILSMVFSPMVLVGLALYAVGTVFWLLALKHLDLSLAYPFVAISFIVVVAIGVLGLGEPFNVVKLAGLALIVAGILVLSRA